MAKLLLLFVLAIFCGVVAAQVFSQHRSTDNSVEVQLLSQEIHAGVEPDSLVASTPDPERLAESDSLEKFLNFLPIQAQKIALAALQYAMTLAR